MRVGQSGHALLYITVFLPIILGGAALSFDISGLNLKLERSQTALDLLVLDSAQYLPDTKAVKDRFVNGIKQIDGHVISHDVSVNSLRSKVSALVQIEESTLLLPKLLNIFGLSSDVKSQTITSEAELAPIELTVILSDGIDQRPWSGSSEENAWLPQSGVGEASTALTSCLIPPVERYSNVETSKVWFNSNEWLTQSCFNPIFSAFKLSAINIAGAALEIGTNRASVIFTPSGNGKAEVIRHVAYGSREGDKCAGYVSPGTPACASWMPYKDLEYELGDEACIVFSDVTTASGGDYSIDKVVQNGSLQRSCLAPILNPKCGSPFSIGDSNRLNIDCLSNTSLSEAIYWRSAKRPTNNFSAVPDFNSALSLAVSEVVPSSVITDQDRKVRGTLASDPGRVIVLLTSTLPELITSEPVLESLIGTKITLIIGYLNREAYPTSIIDYEQQLSRLKQWQTFIDRESPKKRFRNAMYVASSPDELIRSITPRIIASTREVLLRR